MVGKGMAGIHESWIDAELEGEPPAIREAVRHGRGPAGAWLSRHVHARLVPMPRDPGSLALAEPARLVTAIETLGRQRLALALSRAPVAATAALAARLGPPHAAALLSEVSAARSAPPTEIRAAVRELSSLPSDPSSSSSSSSSLLFLAGAQHLAPALVAHGGDLPRQLAQRLPRTLGLLLLAEVGRSASAAPDPPCDRGDHLRRLLDP